MRKIYLLVIYVSLVALVGLAACIQGGVGMMGSGGQVPLIKLGL